MRAVPGDKVGFAKIDEFKGLENDAVIVADLPEPRFWENEPSLAIRSDESSAIRVGARFSNVQRFALGVDSVRS